MKSSNLPFLDTTETEKKYYQNLLYITLYYVKYYYTTHNRNVQKILIPEKLQKN